VEHGAVYFGATGGAAALLCGSVRRASVVAFEDLATEAIRRLEVEDFPLVVLLDSRGKDLYEEGPARYRR
jgi:fumarate hydratase subunit beta